MNITAKEKQYKTAFSKRVDNRRPLSIFTVYRTYSQPHNPPLHFELLTVLISGIIEFKSVNEYAGGLVAVLCVRIA